MAIAKISKRTVDAAIKEGFAAFLWDADLKGFGLKVSARRDETTSARATYILQYRMSGRGSPTRRYTIGGHGSPWTPERARDRATALLEMVRAGIDPAAKEIADADAMARQAATAALLGFSAYADTFLKRRVASQKRAKEVESIFARDLKPHFGDMLVSHIRKSDIIALLDRVGERNGSAANKAHKALKTFFAWAIARDTIAVSPMAGLPAPADDVGKPRDHTLSDAELRLVWLAAGELTPPFGQLVRMLIVTGQRLREVAGISGAEIDTEKRLWTIPRERTKNETTHLVPLSPLAWEILDSVPSVSSETGLVFTTTGKTPISGFSKAKSRLDELVAALAEKEATEEGTVTLAPSPWRLHDLRRTFATGCERLGVPIAVTEAALNHRSGSKRGIVGVYQRHNYAEEKRSALDRWALEVKRIVDRAPAASGSVVDFEAAKQARG